MKRFALLFTLAAVLLTTSLAHAVPAILGEGTRPMWGALAFGPAIKVSDTTTQFKLIQTFGYHFSGNASGPAIAIDLQESFGDDYTTLEIMPKFVWDIRIVQGLGLYVSPFFGLGFAGVYPDCPAGYDCPSVAGMTIQFGVKAKLILGNRGMVFFQPIAFDVLGGKVSDCPAGYQCDWDTGARYDMMFGGGVIF